ncbi:uncharacterized protein LTR77_008447 [Saxophila tyrrhenica]|uniref:RNase III domain-containing protein n=1 Tax=Saxophila tyrrhenica TaxID=1690608 RepID=A0AAV9P108_9PEZI|nr:hypothetical protein LTR77_008447 [Saxophila tyrrhenica]
MKRQHEERDQPSNKKPKHASNAVTAYVPFTHRSTVTYNRAASTAPDLTYDRLEFLGDAYIEIIASRLIFERFNYLPVGRQSQLRELVVKNETLAEYSRAYGLDKRVEVAALEQMREEGKQKGNKGFNKVLGDVFEAYVAAVILSDAEEGFAVAEKWLTSLWAMKLEEAVKDERPVGGHGAQLTHSDYKADARKMYDPAAKAELQKRVLDNGVKLGYEVDRPPLELKGDQLGQNRHFIALYLTGYGYERRLLGKGEGKNKVEAGNWAATDAMHGESKGIVEECAEKLKLIKKERAEKKARLLAEQEAAAAGSPKQETG